MAKNDGKIYITISDTRGGKGGSGTGEVPVKKEKEKEEKHPLRDFAEYKFFSFVESQARQSINYTLNNIGNFTGDYVTQQHVSDAMNIISALTNIGMAAIAGSKYGPVGAVIGAGIAVAGNVITQTQQLVLGYSQNNLQNKQIAQLRTRAGLNSINNGSRGTEY